MKYTEAIAMSNLQTMLKLYQNKNPLLNRKQCIELMKKEERTFLGLDIKQRPNKQRRKK